MRVVEIDGGFGLDRLRVAERAEPSVGPGRVVVRMKAASLNYRDLLTVRGQYNPKQPLPLVPCSDGVGEVVEVGPGVTRVRPGDRVATLFAQSWIAGRPTKDKLRSTLGGPLDGVLSELMVLNANGLVHVPEHLDDVEAATLPCAAVTAWSALTVPEPIRPGETVLVQGTGGVSIFSLQLARLFGARVIVTSSSDEKLRRVRELGAFETINYTTTPDWGKQARRLAGGDGVDRVVDVGGAGTLAQSMVALCTGGQISQLGNLAGASTELNLVALFMRRLRLQGVLVGPREAFEAMNRAIAAGGMRPVVDRVVRLEQTRQALESMATGEHFGKICIRIAD